MLLTILSFMAMIGSLLNLFRSFIKEGKSQNLIYLLVLAVFATSTGYLAFQNRELSSIEYEARALVKSWPDIQQFNPSDSGQYTAIVLRGMVFLEKYKDQFPLTFDNARLIFAVNNMQNQSENVFAEIKQTERYHDLAKKMIMTIRSIGKMPMS